MFRLDPLIIINYDQVNRNKQLTKHFPNLNENIITHIVLFITPPWPFPQFQTLCQIFNMRFSIHNFSTNFVQCVYCLLLLTCQVWHSAAIHTGMVYSTLSNRLFTRNVSRGHYFVENWVICSTKLWSRTAVFYIYLYIYRS